MTVLAVKCSLETSRTPARYEVQPDLCALRVTKFSYKSWLVQKRAEVAERDALVQLVNDQAQQLEMLRAQLIALRSKSTPLST